MIKVAHIITALPVGGAQMMLYKLLTGMDRASFQARVVSLAEVGPVGKQIQSLGVPVQGLGMRRGVPHPVSVLRLVATLRRDQPDVVQTWLPHADLAAGLAAKLAGGMPVAWGIRYSRLDPQATKRATLWTIRACGHLSGWLPTTIVCCSEAARRVHEGLGFAADKLLVIPNGFDLTTFQPDPLARLSVRRELGLPVETALVGLVGTFDPYKDHRTFIQAAALLHAELPAVHFLLCGDGVQWDNLALAGWIDQACLRPYCHLLGRRLDMPRLNAALDVATSCSYSEGFPNVVGEAMACGVPCVVTDVGDSALIVGDTGRVVLARNPCALAAAWQQLLALDLDGRARLGGAARQRIEDHFCLPAIIARYQALYEKLALSTRREPA